MLRLDDPALPRLHTAPFWKPISPEEYGAIVGDPPLPEDLAFGDGWELAAYSIFLGTVGRQTVLGWVRGPFAIADYSPDGEIVFGRLYHLPLGMPISTFPTAELAAFAAAVIEPLTDWSKITRDEGIAHSAAIKDTLCDAGFDVRLIPTAADMHPVWFREIGELN